MTTVYINGVKVSKEDIGNYEIKSEAVKRIISEAVRREERGGEKSVYT